MSAVTIRAVTIRYWAAARDAAGCPQEQCDAGTLAELVAAAGQRHGPRLARVLSYCSYVVDEVPATAPPSEVALRPGSVVEVLPPFAGGAELAGRAGRAERVGRPGGAGPSAAGRSVVVAVCLLAGAALLAVGVRAGRPEVAGAVIVVQVLLGLCWLVLLEAPLPTAVLVGLAALGCDSVLLRSRATTAGSVAGVIGLALVAALVEQLARRNRRDVTNGLATTLSGVVLVAAIALLIPLCALTPGRQVAQTALLAAATGGLLARLLPGPPLVVRLAALVVAAAAGTAFGTGPQDLALGWAVVTAVGAAAFALAADLGVVRAVVDVVPRQRPALAPVAALLPLTCAVPVAYLVGWILSS